MIRLTYRYPAQADPCPIPHRHTLSTSTLCPTSLRRDRRAPCVGMKRIGAISQRGVPELVSWPVPLIRERWLGISQSSWTGPGREVERGSNDRGE
jgi:hypothetical protein